MRTAGACTGQLVKQEQMQKLSTAPFWAAKKAERKVGKGKGKETYPGYFSLSAAVEPR